MIETALREGSHFFAWTHRRIGGEEFPADVLLTRTERAGKMIVQATVRDITERKQAEDELRRASAEWEQTFNAMPDLIMVLNREHRIVQANQAMVTRLGQDGAGLFGRRCYEVVHGTDAPPDFCPHTALLRDGQAHTIETTEGRIGGTFVVSDTPLCDARGTVWGAVHVARDITEHKRAEALLRQSEERFHLLFEQAADSILLLEIMPDGAPVIRDANNTTFKLLGYERDELIGQSVSVIDEASNAAQVVEKRRQEIHAGKGKVFEVKHRCKDGTSRDFECSVTEIQIGAKMFALSVERDITDRMRAAESQARLATAVEQAAEAIVITDIEGTIIYTNPAFEKITGYPRQEVYGHIWHFLQSGKHTVAFFQKIWAVLHAGQVWRGRLINKRKDGMLYEEDVTISPVLDAAGQLINYVAVKRDVTREVALETQIRQNAKMAAVGQLAGGVAHDFNNKLQIILFSVELLLKDMPRKHPFRADLQDIQEAARRSIDLTRQLLTFSRQQPITPKVLDLNAAIAGSLKMLGRLIGENIRLTFTAQQELWSVSMDPGQLDQVLANLTVNARDAIAGAGMITIAAANRTLLAADCQDKPDFVPPGDYVELTVRDTGAGMTPEIQARIFEPFFTTKEVGKGTGLGLATVYGIVKQNNGGIAVQSTVGQGTTFSIYLPRSREAVLADTQTAAARSSTGTETILLVEDEERILDLAKRVLTKQGYQVVTALAPAEAVRLCASSPAPFHLLLTDVIMPGMSGLELAERLQKLQPGIRVLYMSGYTAGIMKQHGHLPEGTQVLQKPFTGESLTQHVRAALDAPPASRRNASLPFVSRFRSWWTGYGRV
jgi:PAS domain S-box-containing protein